MATSTISHPTKTNPITAPRILKTRLKKHLYILPDLQTLKSLDQITVILSVPDSETDEVPAIERFLAAAVLDEDIVLQQLEGKLVRSEPVGHLAQEEIRRRTR